MAIGFHCIIDAAHMEGGLHDKSGCNMIVCSASGPLSSGESNINYMQDCTASNQIIIKYKSLLYLALPFTGKIQ